MTRVLAVDPGEVRLGVAISDPTASIARPLTVIRHTNRRMDALKIAETAAEHSVDQIVVGVAFDQDGRPGPQARRAQRLIEAIRLETDLPVDSWDESGSTVAATSLPRRGAELDARAAAVILQEYLDARRA